MDTLQKDLQSIYNWAERVNMFFNGDKFEAFRCWTSERTNDHHYKSSDGTPIDEPGDLKDLGVRLSSDLTFSKHIQAKMKIARKQAGWVLRSFRTRTKKVMMTILKSIIQPHLDYCSPIWSPTTQNIINDIEDIQ